MNSSAKAPAQVTAPAPAPAQTPTQAPAQAPPRSLSASELSRQRATTKMPGEEMTIAETLRVMDVAREMREQRESAEQMFRHDEVRIRLREKLMRTAALSGDRVTEAEIDAAIDQYLGNLHTYESPKGGFKKLVAYCWIWRYRLSAAAITATAAGAWLFF